MSACLQGKAGAPAGGVLQTTSRTLSPSGKTQGILVLRPLTEMLINVESSVAATKELLLVPETLALSEQRLIYDSNLNLMWQPSRPASQPRFAHLIGRRWMVKEQVARQPGFNLVKTALAVLMNSLSVQRRGDWGLSQNQGEEGRGSDLVTGPWLAWRAFGPFTPLPFLPRCQGPALQLLTRVGPVAEPCCLTSSLIRKGRKPDLTPSVNSSSAILITNLVTSK